MTGRRETRPVVVGGVDYQRLRSELSWETEFNNSAVFFFRPIEDLTDVLKEPFEIRPGIVISRGSYHFNRPRVSFSIPPQVNL